MKKVVVLTVRVDTEADAAIRALARADDRSIARVTRTQLIEALTARQCLKPQDDKQHGTVSP